MVVWEYMAWMMQHTPRFLHTILMFIERMVRMVRMV
jgi:hypothetical protein